MKAIVGIDPGASGGFAIYENGAVKLYAMPNTKGDVAELIRSLSMTSDCFYIEQVQGYIGGKGNTGSTMFKFGENYGFMLGCLQILSIRVELVTPQVWQKSIVQSGLKEKAERKRRIKENMQRLYPMADGITLKTADALGILHYALGKENLRVANFHYD